MTHQIRIGPAGWSYKDWENVVYPKHGSKFDHLAYLASFFDTIEINSPFYRIPPPTHSKSWVRRVASNPDFRFTTKIFRGFTHEETAPPADDVQAFRNYLDPMMDANRLGAILIQFPWSFKNTPESLERLETLFRAFGDYPKALEVRHATFQDDAFLKFLDEHDVSWVNVDQPLFHDSVKPADTVTGPIGYARLHGRNYEKWFAHSESWERYNYLYSEEELAPWVDRIGSMAKEKETYVITNNHFRGQAILNAGDLMEALGQDFRMPPQLKEVYGDRGRVRASVFGFSTACGENTPHSENDHRRTTKNLRRVEKSPSHVEKPKSEALTPLLRCAPMTRKKRVVGTAGHIDHGKTSLVRALTGIDTDRLPEEKRRGITIDLGFASWFTDDDQIGFVDVPGHERFVKNMLAGIGGIDSALLVVAADESIMPQTREHFAICRLLGIPTGLVAITKSDLVEREMLDLVRMEIEELVAGSFLEGKPIVPVSSTTGAGLDELRAAILQSVASVDDRDATTRVFRLPIDRVFTMKGFGSVITGTTYSGRVRVEDEVEVLPGGKRSRARAIQVHGQPRDEASAGERTSMNLADIPLDELHRGQQILHPDTLRPSQVITVRLELLEDAKPLKEQTRIRFHHLSAELLGTIRFVDDTEGDLRPGARAFAQIRLEAPVVAAAGDRFVIRRYSPAFTIGGGVILDAHLSKLSHGTRVEILEALESGTLQERVQWMAKLQGLRGLTIDEVQARTGIRAQTLIKELRKVPNVVSAGSTLLHHDVLTDFRRRAIEFLNSYFKTNKMAVNVPKSEFAQKLIPAGAPVNFLLADLANEKIAVVQGDALDIPGRSKTLGGAEGELARAIEARFAEAGLQTPAVSEIIKAIPQKPKVIEGVIGYLVKQGALVRLAEGVYLHRNVIADAREKLSTKKGQTIDVGAFKDLFGISRKVAIPLLEFFDKEGTTKRMGDARQVL